MKNLQVGRGGSLPARALAAWACAAAFVLGGVPAAAQTVPTGSIVHVELTSADINTKNAQVGDGFTMGVVPPYPDGDNAFASAVVRGHIDAVRSAGQGRKAQMHLAFDRVIFANGTSAPLSGAVTTMKATHDNSTARKALGSGAGAAVGSQTIGRIIGGAAGGVVGILGGAVAGYLYASNMKTNFSIVKGSPLTIQTQAPLEIPRSQAR